MRDQYHRGEWLGFQLHASPDLDLNTIYSNLLAAIVAAGLDESQRLVHAVIIFRTAAKAKPKQ